MVSWFFVDFVMKSYEEYAEDLLNSEKIVDESSDKDNLSNWRKKDEFKYPGIYLVYPKFKINDGKQIYLKVGISRGLKRRIRDHFSSRVTDRDPTKIVHTTDYKVMLEEALKTEQKAAKGYEAVHALIKDDEEMYDSIEQIYFQELRSVEEVTQLL